MDKLWSQVSSLLPPGSCLQFFIAHRVQQFHYSSIFHQVLLTHALALSASQFVLKKKSPRIHTSMHSGGLELTKLTYTRLEDILIRHRGDYIWPLGNLDCTEMIFNLTAEIFSSFFSCSTSAQNVSGPKIDHLKKLSCSVTLAAFNGVVYL